MCTRKVNGGKNCSSTCTLFRAQKLKLDIEFDMRKSGFALRFYNSSSLFHFGFFLSEKVQLKSDS